MYVCIYVCIKAVPCRFAKRPFAKRWFAERWFAETVQAWWFAEMAFCRKPGSSNGFRLGYVRLGSIKVIRGTGLLAKRRIWVFGKPPFGKPSFANLPGTIKTMYKNSSKAKHFTLENTNRMDLNFRGRIYC
jgi:hypothetical protein